ncbi:hypothetical protein E2562_019894 [Oryza meyeriana var. granulata]|uniref:Uncharacterized protein n=1 Tax=Oryza meyeriana var. granulata TaxID=110450 RepID=A0A6G1EXI3_9ORYZ|nr:hypothetical protein E2562_019894 [Oryza meyeriana var. granulata]
MMLALATDDLIHAIAVTHEVMWHLLRLSAMVPHVEMHFDHKADPEQNRLALVMMLFQLFRLQFGLEALH